ncbi:IclR family transcriptional regulator [Microbacterium sp. CPCC 204701]|uniref:IclR family transcriptional regulator n=1 Tax=Microbacterium sp. CPCC 204701 TaxID=2493084 RepID=UPI0013E3C032|nr:IclR family transcriptional regulator [Microbacterium sp. CPCC 204701]
MLDRILAVLNAVREADGESSIAHIAATTGIPKSTVSRLVGDLVRQRYLTRTDRSVQIGLRLFELGARATTPRRLRAAAMPVLAELYNATGEHLNVAVQEGCHMLSVISVRGRLRPAPSRAGARVPSATTALGKAVLAFADGDATLTQVITDLDADQRDSLEREFPSIRSEGVALDRCGTFPGVIGIASPVLSLERAPVAAISAAGPVNDMDPDRVAPLVRHAALVLTRRLATTAG